MEQSELLHADRHGTSFNFTLILAVIVAVVGLFMDPIVVIIGLAVAAFSWFTTPSRYMIFNDRLVIAYGKPRLRHVFFQQVDQLELLRLAIGSRLRVHLSNGRSLFIQPRDAEEFQSRFQSALESYRRDHGGEMLDQES